MLILPAPDPMQLVDELSMIYTTCVMVFATFSYSRSPRFAVFLGVALLGLAGFITVRLAFSKAPQLNVTSLNVEFTDLLPPHQESPVSSKLIRYPHCDSKSLLPSQGPRDQVP